MTLEKAMLGPMKDWTWGDWFFAQDMLVEEIKRLQRLREFPELEATKAS